MYYIQPFRLCKCGYCRCLQRYDACSRSSLSSCEGVISFDHLRLSQLSESQGVSDFFFSIVPKQVKNRFFALQEKTSQKQKKAEDFLKVVQIVKADNSTRKGKY
jgi:hypothetical protein